MSTDLILFWHRRDLRISDNVGLSNARSKTPNIIGVFCFDPAILNRDDVAGARISYLLGSLTELQEKYRSLGSELVILHGNPCQAIPKLAQELNANSVDWNIDFEPYSRQRDDSVIKALSDLGIAYKTNFDQLLHHPNEIYSSNNKLPYTVYTPFWKNWILQTKLAPVPLLTRFIIEVKDLGINRIPSITELGYSWNNPLLLAPGEIAAKQQLQLFRDHHLGSYQAERNYPYIDGTSQLSAALKFGVIGIREIWQTTQELLAKTEDILIKESIKTWQQELAWREFYQHSLYHFPRLATEPHRVSFKEFAWENNHNFFQAWCQGQTGYPIVDAAMRQLNQTGWMHNRCRMIVASFLTKDLIVNWQWGERYFMQRLYDGDLAANNGGWQWSASCGLDPKPLRIFNPITQALKFDPKGEYIRQWIPELRLVDTKAIVSGKITPLERHRAKYPLPIVDHNQQQQKFKELYKQIKT